jgi:hypothetical protein
MNVWIFTAKHTGKDPIKQDETCRLGSCWLGIQNGFHVEWERKYEQAINDLE